MNALELKQYLIAVPDEQLAKLRVVMDAPKQIVPLITTKIESNTNTLWLIYK